MTRSGLRGGGGGGDREAGGGGGRAPDEGGEPGIPWLAAAVSFGAALGLALGLAGVAHPEIIFPKYLAAAVAAPGEQAERLLDYSPLYLGLVRVLLPWGAAGILVAQAVLHAVTAAAVAVAVALAARRGRWEWPAWLGGLGVAAYRPFLVYSGVHEPETVILACLAAAIVAGLLARARLRSPRGWARDGAQGGGGVGQSSPGSPGGWAGDGAAVEAAAADAADAAAVERRPGGPVEPPGSGWAGRWTWALTALAFMALAGAGLGRPQFVALVPVWGWWMAAAAARGGRGAVHRRVWMAAAVACAAVLGPPVWVRARATGWPTIMNPGAVFYEGNGPGATGLTRFAPAAVIELERAHRESIDYGHVAYRRIAALALGGAGRRLEPAAGRPLTVAAVNRYWTGLAWEGMAARPGGALERFGRKALMAVMPYEGHDLIVAERLDRRLRQWLPWGFAVPLLALPWAVLARRRRIADLMGPLALAALAAAVQVATYASARQRLPLALALWLVLPVLLADVLRGELWASVRPALALLAGVCVALGLAAATGRVAVLDQVGWDELLGGRPPGLGEGVAALLDGRAFRPQLRQTAERLAAGADLARRRRPADSLRALAPLLGAGADLTSDDRKVGVAEYWAALDLLALGERSQAAAAASAAAAVRPEDPRLAALAMQLAAPRNAPPRTGPWRPPGCDPASAHLALAAAAAADRDRPGLLAALAPLAADLPELLPRQR
jgi:hypothetical protein